MAQIVSINISAQKGTFKYPVQEAELRVDHGIIGDAHSGPWHRQISLLAAESIERMIEAGAGELKAGMFAENITTRGIELFALPVGTKLRLGECLVEVTQIGKKCHQHCEIYHRVGHCVMPTEGIFVKVLHGGNIRPGDELRVIELT